ncbi:hypothetical protein U91I_03885 [alpha proteobacterium U9-1i]|nr:hypothetical protein U91I_03885 [alpha proteobacterium U9-1i]
MPRADPDAAAKAEARAAHALAHARGRVTTAPAPKAGKAVAAVARTLLPKAGMGLSEIKRRWTEIVGPSYAGKTAPEKFAGGVLTLRAPSALAPFLQQQAPLLIERLKLAGAKVSSIRIEQRALPPKPATNLRPLRKPVSAAEKAALAQSLDRVPDAGLKSALLRLGLAMKQR